MKNFDPNQAATEDSGVFGLPFTEGEAKLVLIPVPWEVTTSYGGGTSNGPAAILEASKQVDLFDFDVLKPYEPGIAMLDESQEVRKWNSDGKKLAAPIIEVGGAIEGDSDLKKKLERVNSLGGDLNNWLKAQVEIQLRKDKIVGVVGGDHAVPFGAFQAIGEKVGDYGILHFDAHSDTREAFEGFQWSHASIMHNALEKIPQIKKLVQVGIRDFCEQEWDYMKSQGERGVVYFQSQIRRRQMQGEAYSTICDEIVKQLPKKVWVSFDIDGLDPKLCPNTGTPVAGGLEFEEAVYLLRKVVESKREIIGFDLNEVSPGQDENDEWDANVGARLLYKLCAFALASNGHCPLL